MFIYKKKGKIIIDKLVSTGTLNRDEIMELLLDDSKETTSYLTEKALETRKKHFSNKIYIRGLIEFTSYCKNDCLYCGLRCSNSEAQRYRLDNEEILLCCERGYELGFRTFVLQGGEDPYWNDERLTTLVREIKEKYPDCALTLSVGERDKESYKALYNAGADRFLLRHETATAEHYKLLHPSNMSFDNRMNCLKALKEIGFQTGCGFMIGSPGQTLDNIVSDLLFIKDFKPEMVGIGPFIPAKNTPFEGGSSGSVDMTLKLISIIRLLLPNALIPATTALGTVNKDGRQLGILAGANVIMPNLSPSQVRDKYSIYDNKVSIGLEGAEGIEALKKSFADTGFEIVTDKGDHPSYIKNRSERIRENV